MPEVLDRVQVAAAEELRGAHADAVRFLQVMGEAIHRGDVHLLPYYSSTVEASDGCLGYYTDEAIVIRERLAAEMWAQASGRSTYSIRHMWQALRLAGAGADMVKANIGGHSYSARRLDRGVVRDLMGPKAV